MLIRFFSQPRNPNLHQIYISRPVLDVTHKWQNGVSPIHSFIFLFIKKPHSTRNNKECPDWWIFLYVFCCRIFPWKNVEPWWKARHTLLWTPQLLHQHVCASSVGKNSILAVESQKSRHLYVGGGLHLCIWNVHCVCVHCVCANMCITFYMGANMY